jgi:hypothetical protein
MKKKIKSIVIVFMSLLWVACDPGHDTVELGDPTTCEGCHTSKETLEQYAEGDASGGAGGG